MESILRLVVVAGLCRLSPCATRYQYVLFHAPKTWREAQSYCRDKCVDLATFSYMEEMKEFLELIEGKYDGAVWFGLVKGETMKWHWSMTAKDFYKDGEKDYMQWDEKPTYHCGLIRANVMSSQPCTNTRYFICFDGGDRYILIKTPLGWTQALEYCRHNYVDLASVRNAEEYNAVQSVVGGYDVWFGLFRDPWAWSDLADSSLRYWPEDFKIWAEDAESCGVLLKDESGRWGARDCSEAHPFVCSCIASAETIVKVRIDPHDSGLDFDDPAVQDSILEQLKLETNGTGDVTLRWKTRPDGRVFVKDNP